MFDVIEVENQVSYEADFDSVVDDKGWDRFYVWFSVGYFQVLLLLWINGLDDEQDLHEIVECFIAL